MPALKALSRFGLLSIASFAINLGVTVFLHEVLGTSEELAFAAALLTVFITNFLACRYFVFNASAGDPRRQLFVFALSSLGFRASEYLAFLLIHSLLGAPYLAAILAILGISTLVKYFYYGTIVFKPPAAAVQTDAGSTAHERRAVAQLVLISLATTLVFSNTLHNEMHLDSVYRIKNNPEIEYFWPPWRHFVDPYTSSSLDTIVQYRPLLPLSLSVNVVVSDWLGIGRLAGFHLGNIAIHLGNAMLLYLLLCELLRQSAPAWSRERRTNVAFAASLLFAVHPVAGVPVNYLCARDLLMMMFFLLGSLLVYTRMRRSGDTRGGWAAALSLLALSMLAKQNGVVAPALILMYEILVAGSPLRSRATWLRPLAFALVIVGFFVWTTQVLGFSDLDQLAVHGGDRWTYMLSMAKVHVFYYLRNFVWPFELRPLPLIEAATGLREPAVLAGGAVIFGTLVAAFALWRRAPIVSYAILAYWVLLAPTSSIRPFRYLAADYRQYPSLAFLCLLLVLALMRLPARRPVVAAFVALVVYFGVSSYAMNRVWRTEETLWSHSVRYGARSIAHLNYARSVQRRDPALAEQHYRLALSQSPQNAYATMNLGLLYVRTGRSEEGLALLRRAVELAPPGVEGMARHWLAVAFDELDRRVDAAAEHRRAADADQRNVEYQYLAAEALQRQAETAASLPYLERVAALSPGYRRSLFLEAWAHHKAGDWARAEQAYRGRLRQNPSDVQAWFNLAHGLMEAGRHREAIEAFDEVLRLDPGRRSAHHWLAICYEALGDAEAAARHADLYRSGDD